MSILTGTPDGTFPSGPDRPQEVVTLALGNCSNKSHFQFHWQSHLTHTLNEGDSVCAVSLCQYLRLQVITISSAQSIIFVVFQNMSSVKPVPVLTAVFVCGHKKVTNEPGFHFEFTFCRIRYRLMTA